MLIPCKSYLAEVVPADDLNKARLDAYYLGPTVYPEIICTNLVRESATLDSKAHKILCRRGWDL